MKRGEAMKKIEIIIILLCITCGIISAAGTEELDLTKNIFDISASGNKFEVSLTIKNGGDVNARNDFGSTPLMYAAEINDNPEVLTVLLDAGADVNARDDDGRTPLMYAARDNDNPEVLTVLLDAGADVRAQDSESWTPLVYATKLNSNFDISRAFLMIEQDKDISSSQLQIGLEESDSLFSVSDSSELSTQLQAWYRLEQYIELYESLFHEIKELEEEQMDVQFDAEELVIRTDSSNQTPSLWETDQAFEERIEKERHVALSQFQAEKTEKLRRVAEGIASRKKEVLNEYYVNRDKLFASITAGKILSNEFLKITPLGYKRNEQTWPFLISASSEWVNFDDYLLEVDVSEFGSVKDTVIMIDDAIKTGNLFGEIDWTMDFNTSTQNFMVVINEISLNHGITKNRISKAYSKGKILQNVSILNPSITNLFTDLTIEVTEPLFFDENVSKELDSKIEIPVSQSISLKDVFERIFNPEKYFQPGALLVTIGNPKIAEINQNFVLKAKNNGSTYLKINDMYGKILGSIEIIVPYSIGDIGPAGGLVFYENSNWEVDGWRYLEAASVSYEYSGKVWGGYGTVVGGTGTAIGTGKSNTENIVDKFGNAEPYTNKTDYAAKLCSDLVYGGYDDWFLPSKDELNRMYLNLKLNNLGFFSVAYYWSSSEGPANGAWYQDFFNGYQYSSYRGYGNRVRPVRAF